MWYLVVKVEISKQKKELLLGWKLCGQLSSPAPKPSTRGLLSSSMIKHLLAAISGFKFVPLLHHQEFFFRERGRERGRERILSSLHAQHRTQCQAPYYQPESVTWAKIKSPKLHWLSHSGTPASPELCWVITSSVFLCGLYIPKHVMEALELREWSTSEIIQNTTSNTKTFQVFKMLKFVKWVKLPPFKTLSSSLPWAWK